MWRLVKCTGDINKNRTTKLCVCVCLCLCLPALRVRCEDKASSTVLNARLSMYLLLRPFPFEHKLFQIATTDHRPLHFGEHFAAGCISFRFVSIFQQQWGRVALWPPPPPPPLSGFSSSSSLQHKSTPNAVRSTSSYATTTMSSTTSARSANEWRACNVRPTPRPMSTWTFAASTSRRQLRFSLSF